MEYWSAGGLGLNALLHDSTTPVLRPRALLLNAHFFLHFLPGAEVCGSTSLFQKHPLERFYRDMHLHMLHGRHDIAAQIVGAFELGEPYDVNRAH